ncbi:MAG: cation:proton antiporter [Candidatus Riflebacteria bacterium]|nr:cation:proton antiporter [Candidatus Riflebacteria bacterium]
MDRLALLGLMLLGALALGKTARRFTIPKVSGYLVAGLLLGPSGLAAVTGRDIGEMGLISRLAIALILFDIGGELDVATVRQHGGRALLSAMLEGAVTLALVFTVVWWVSSSVALALLLACIAVETSPSATILVVKEVQARGPFTMALLSFVAADVVIAISAFHVSLALLGIGGPVALLQALGGALGLGVLFGWMIGKIGSRLSTDLDLLLFVFGMLLLLQGFSRSLGASRMIATLVCGAAAASSPAVRGRIFDILKPIAGVLYAVMFVMAGAALHLDLLRDIGKVGVAYVVTRILGKALGGLLGGAMQSEQLRRWKVLPLGLFPHAGVAIGLTLTLSELQPALAPTVTVVVLSAVVLFELIGPIATSACLRLAGEAGQPTDVLDLEVLEGSENGGVNNGGAPR